MQIRFGIPDLPKSHLQVRRFEEIRERIFGEIRLPKFVIV